MMRRGNDRFFSVIVLLCLAVCGAFALTSSSARAARVEFIQIAAGKNTPAEIARGRHVPPPSNPTTSPRRLVRVGSTGIDNLFVHTPFGASGFGVAYLEQLSRFTGWMYEFVPGTWEEQLEGLRNGTIDLLFPAQRNPAREREFLFSRERCANDFVALYARIDDNSLFYEDFEQFNGLRVGLLEGNSLNELFDEEMNRRAIRMERRYYPDNASLHRALENKSIDVVAYGVMFDSGREKVIAKFDFAPSYFMTGKNNAKLMAELDEAHKQLYHEDLFFYSKIFESHYKSLSRLPMSFSREEMERIKTAGVVTVICDGNSFPLEWYDPSTGQCTGVYAELTRLIFDKSGLRVRYVPSSSVRDSWERFRLRDGQILNSAVDAPLLRASHDMVTTNSYFTAEYAFITKDTSRFSLDSPLRVAIHQDQLGARYFISQKYPHWILLPSVSADACLQAVREGRADVAAINALTLQIDPLLAVDSSLFAVFNISLSLPVRMAVGVEQQYLVPILNKAMLYVSEEQMASTLLSSTLAIKKPPSLTSLIHSFPKTSLFAVSVLTALLLYALFGLWMDRMRRKQHTLLQSNYDQLQQIMSEKAELKIRSETDPLTGLYNKATFSRMAENLLDEQRDTCTLIFMDLDNFKQLNDRFGHLLGDKLLIRLATFLRTSFRDCDLMGRFGGDEFYVFVVGIPEAALRTKLEQLAAKVCEYSLKIMRSQAMADGAGQMPAAAPSSERA